MKSNKQRRAEIKAARLKKAQKQAGTLNTRFGPIPLHAMKADHAELAHNNTYGLLPLFYIDKPFVCRDCGSHEIWTAKQQKWWYEVAKGHIDSTAVRCRRCRNKIRDAKHAQKQHMAEMASHEPHPNQAFFNKKF